MFSPILRSATLLSFFFLLPFERLKESQVYSGYVWNDLVFKNKYLSNFHYFITYVVILQKKKCLLLKHLKAFLISKYMSYKV